VQLCHHDCIGAATKNLVGQRRPVLISKLPVCHLMNDRQRQQTCERFNKRALLALAD
jgi:hypothetical protein